GEVPVTATYAGLRPATQHKDYQITHQDDRRYVSVGGIRSTGLSSALGVAEAVWARLAAAHTPIDAPMWPEPPMLADDAVRDWAKDGHGGIVCHCELVTRREVEAALTGPLPARTLQGLKRRTRVTMGRCQGFYCLGTLAEITKARLAVPIAEPVEG
ncbi:MAG: (2Fe-2S)-binding protein, partial [Pseudomonadota bacterium]